jgi:hypothetical protein
MVTYSSTKLSFTPFFALPLILLLFFVSGCNQSSDQRDFERAAFSEADGFTRTTGSGEVQSRDPDDWRIAPFFQGLIEVDPAYPNPVLSNDQVVINLIITGVESVSGLWVFAYYGPNDIRELFQDDRRPIPPGATTIRLNPLTIARFPENPQGLYRIVITDATQNVITYGDIMIE